MRGFLFWALSVACLFGSTITTHGQTLQDIRLGTEAAQTRAVIEIDGAVDYQVLLLSSPPRLVVDVRGLRRPDGFEPSQSRTGLVRNVRLGQFSDSTVRVVFDLTQSVQLRHARALRPQSGRGYRLVLDMVAGVPEVTGATIAQGDFGGSGSQTTASPSTTATTTASSTPAPPVSTTSGTPTGQRVALPVERPRTSDQPRYLIVLDPGHGGRDPGAIAASGLKEADLVLEVAKEVSRVLRGSGRYEVLLTRGRDNTVDLFDRADLARGRGADFFVSIHANANDDLNFRGFMVFTLSENAAESYGQEVSERDERADELGGIADVPDEELVDIFQSIITRDMLNQSADFAARLVRSLNGKVRFPSNPHRRKGFEVLKSLKMPSALLEIGHLSNATEAREMQSASYRRKIATGVLQALDGHFDSH